MSLDHIKLSADMTLGAPHASFWTCKSRGNLQDPIASQICFTLIRPQMATALRQMKNSGHWTAR